MVPVLDILILELFGAAGTTMSEGKQFTAGYRKGQGRMKIAC
jgi:hypothetical protein